MLHSRILRSPHQETAPHLCLTHFSHTVLIIGNTQHKRVINSHSSVQRTYILITGTKGRLEIGTERAGDWDGKGWGSGRKGLGIGTERAGDRDGKGCY